MPKRSSKPIYRAMEAVNKTVHQRIDAKKGLQFVYDLVPVTCRFQELGYTLDAGRSPMRDLANDLFYETYGLQKTLTFKAAEPRETAPSDLWTILY